MTGAVRHYAPATMSAPPSEPQPGTPLADGFRMPAEWEPHAGCWMIWPERPDNWRLGAKPAQAAFTVVADAISRFEPVTMLVSAGQYAQARAALPIEVRVVEMSTDDCWVRDVGPTFLLDGHGTLAGVDWVFNAYGGLGSGLYFPWAQDDAVASKVLGLERARRYRCPLVLEGGAVHTDGVGTLLTTEDVVLDPDRNPGWTRADATAVLRDHLGVQDVVWLPSGIPGDETGGHIDDLACFTSPGVVVLSWCDDPGDSHADVSHSAETALQAAGLEVHRIPMPPVLRFTAEEVSGIDRTPSGMLREPGGRLAASYANFYIADGAVIVPTFGVSTDDEALDVLAGLFPGREVVGVPSREILLGGGNIHCITQQQPASRTG